MGHSRTQGYEPDETDISVGDMSDMSDKSSDMSVLSLGYVDQKGISDSSLGA